jgi:Tol biopolymer transport system component
MNSNNSNSKIPSNFRQFIAGLLLYSIVFQTVLFFPTRTAAQDFRKTAISSSQGSEGFFSAHNISGWWNGSVNFLKTFALAGGESFSDILSSWFKGEDSSVTKNSESDPPTNENEASRQTVTAFGPKQFNRTKGAPNEYVETFTLPQNCTNGTYKITVKNGTATGSNRVSSGVITLNGADVFTQSDFNQNVYLLEKQITLATNNTLEIRLASAPNSYLIIEIKGENCANADTIAPKIVITSPIDNTATINAAINLSGTSTDLGVNPSGVSQVLVNNVAVSYNQSNKVWQLNSAPLVQGVNDFTVKAIDNAGNMATSQVTVIRDLTNPVVTIDTPANNSTTLVANTNIGGNASDPGADASGISTVKVNGADAIVDLQTGNWTLGGVSLNIGNNTFTVIATDRAGNQATTQIVVRRVVNQAPTVNAGTDLTVDLPNSANLNGSISDDGYPEGVNLSAVWNKISGDGEVTFANPDQTQTTVTFSQAGTYVLRLTGSDSLLNASDEITVVVRPANQAPQTNAGMDQTIDLPNAAQLTGTATDDGLPNNTLAYSWSKVSGEGNVSFTNPGNLQTTANFSQSGVYVLRLTVSDGQLSSSDDVSITVIPQNQAPQINAGTDQIINLPNEVSLSGTVTDDELPQGSNLSATWTKVSGDGTVIFNNPNSLNTTASFSQPGIYVLRLSATDGQLTANDDITITVNPGNQAPQTNAGADQTITFPSGATLTGTATDDGLPQSNNLFFNWSKVSGEGTVNFADPTNLQTNVTVTQPGVYVLRLTANDSVLSGSDDVTITVNPPVNQPPTVNAGDDFSIQFPNNTATLNGATNDDGYPIGSNLQINWSKTAGNGNVSFSNTNAINSNVSFDVPGNYTLRLTASDGQLTVFDEINVVVIPQNQSPQVNAGDDQTIVLPNNALLNGTATDDGLPNNNLSVSWSQVSGSAPVSFANSNSLQTNISFTQPGIYILRLSATDGQFNSSDDVTVTVTSPIPPPQVNAGADQSIALPALVNLSGIVNDGGQSQGSNLTVSWSKVSGPGSVTFTNLSALQTTAAFTLPGTYVLKLSASNANSSASDEVTITVTPAAKCFTGDDFNDNAIDLTKWLYPSANSKVYERSERLEVYPIPNTTGYYGYRAAQACDLTGFIATVEMVETTPQVYLVETYFLVENAGGNGDFFLFATGGGNFVPQLNKQNAILTRPVFSWNPTYKFWRLEHNPFTDRIVWKTSPDGINWNVIHSYPRVFPLTNMRFFLTAGTYQPLADPGRAVFDNFTLRFYDGSNNPDTNQAPTVNAGRDQTSTVFSGNNQSLFLMNETGGNQTQLTFTKANEEVSDWSGNGSFILLSSNRDGNREIYVMNRNGLNQTRLTFNSADDFSPHFSPDGTKILFSSNRTGNYDIYQMNFDGSNVINLTNTPENEIHPRWQPSTTPGVNGNLIAYSKYFNNDSSSADIWLMNSNGSNQRAIITSNGTDEKPFWNKTGSRLGYTGTINGNKEIYSINPDGSNSIRLTNDVAANTAGDWSPDGAKILEINNNSGNQELYSLTVFDLIRTRLTINPADVSNALWSANENKIVFSSNREGVYLQGSVIDDGLPQGNSISVNWSKRSGPGDVIFRNPTSAATVATFSEPGIYELELTASDGSATGSDNLTIVVSPLPNNQVPIVNAGTDQVVTQGSSTDLNGLVSDDGLPAPGSVTYFWSKVSGPGEAVFSNQNSFQTRATFSQSGTYRTCLQFNEK